MLRKIRLYGQLAKFVGHRVLQADIATAAEAIKFLIANFPELEAHMADQYYQVNVGTYSLELSELHDPAGSQDVEIIPVIGGAGGATSRILIGIGLIAASFLFPGAGIFGSISVFNAAAGTGILTAAGTIFSAVGATLILGGVSQLLSPVPRVQQGPGSDNDPRKTFNFSGIQQTSRQGTPVPIVYGLTLCGSVVISAGVDTVQVSA